MRSRYQLIGRLLLDLGVVTVLVGGIFYCGKLDERARAQPEILRWQARAAQSEPLIRQWRTGYEQLQARCGER